MASPYKYQFLESAQNEVEELVKKETWYEDLKSNATTGVIPCKWVFRIKRTSDGTIRKFKGRVVLRGDLQEDTGEDNYSPVAAWPTVRSFLVMSVILGWVTTSIDFSNAFVQSELPEDKPVWMAVPRGFISTKGHEYCLRLRKSLMDTEVLRCYGLNTPARHSNTLDWFNQNTMSVCGMERISWLYSMWMTVVSVHQTKT